MNARRLKMAGKVILLLDDTKKVRDALRYAGIAIEDNTLLGEGEE